MPVLVVSCHCVCSHVSGCTSLLVGGDTECAVTVRQPRPPRWRLPNPQGWDSAPVPSLAPSSPSSQRASDSQTKAGTTLAISSATPTPRLGYACQCTTAQCELPSSVVRAPVGGCERFARRPCTGLFKASDQARPLRFGLSGPGSALRLGLQPLTHVSARIRRPPSGLVNMTHSCFKNRVHGLSSSRGTVLSRCEQRQAPRGKLRRP